MRTTSFLITLAGLGLAAGCHSSPPSEKPAPKTGDAEVARQRHVQDSLAVVARATADSVERARQAALASKAKADSIEQVRLAAETAALKAADEAAAKNALLRDELGIMLHFDVAKASIHQDGMASLDRKVAILAANPTVRLRITGAADDRGSDQYNQTLGDRRAAAVKQYLVEKGIDAARLDQASTGEKSPIDAGTGEAAWAMNRRAEFVIVSGDLPLAMK